MSPRQQIRTPSTAILKRLGASVPEAFDLDSSQLVPTMQVLDLAASVATEPVEARGVAGWYTAGSAVGVSVWECLCLSPGGLIVEHVAFDTENAASFTQQPTLHIGPPASPTPHMPWGTGFIAGINAGGVAMRSRTAQWYNTVGVLGPGVQLSRFEGLVMAQTRLYIPPGQCVRVAGALNRDHHFTVVLRELADIQAQ